MKMFALTSAGNRNDYWMPQKSLRFSLVPHWKNSKVKVIKGQTCIKKRRYFNKSPSTLHIVLTTMREKLVRIYCEKFGTMCSACMILILSLEKSHSIMKKLMAASFCQQGDQRSMKKLHVHWFYSPSFNSHYWYGRGWPWRYYIYCAKT